jgi:hypothetical protein
MVASAAPERSILEKSQEIWPRLTELLDSWVFATRNGVLLLSDGVRSDITHILGPG